VFLENYVTKDIKINCYIIDKLFIEVVYDGKRNVITEIKRFKYGINLKKFNSNIRLNTVLNKKIDKLDYGPIVAVLTKKIENYEKN